MGFEAVPNYAEESRDPRRIVPRATLISVIGLGIGYVITSLAFVSAFARDDLVEAAQDPAGPFFVAMREFGSNGLATAMQVLILTGSFACAMAFHNVAMRYFYAMGREGILPRALGRTHPTHRSPYVASVVQTCIAVALVLAWGAGTGFGFARRVRRRLRPHLHDDGRPGRGLDPRHPGRLRGRRDRLAPAPQAPGLGVGRRGLPGHRGRSARSSRIYLLFKNIDTLAGTIGYVDLIAPIAVLAVVGSDRLRDGAQAPQPREVRHDRAHDRRGGHAVAA